MKKIIYIPVVFLFFQKSILAQKEQTIPLSKQSVKGYMHLAEFDDDKLSVTYKIPLKKKSEEVLYEQYVFDNELNFKGSTPISIPKEKEAKPARTRKTLTAYVGGNTSFDVLSMKLKIRKETWEERWNIPKQRYEMVNKSFVSELIKPKKDVERYLGHALYFDENRRDSMLVVVAYDAPEKKEGRLFSVLSVNIDGDITETPITSHPGYSLVKSGILENNEICVILAPKNGNEYIIAQYTIGGKELYKNTFKAPSPNLLITDYTEHEGKLYLTGISKNNTDPYDNFFENYAPIQSLGYTEAANYQQFKYEKRAFDTEASTFHLLNFSKGQLLQATSTPVQTFASKVKTPPSQKKKHPYKGNRFEVQRYYVAPNGDSFIAGQIIKRKMVEKTLVRTYMDIVCFHFDSQGNLKAQYAVEKMLNDTKSELFPMIHNFIPSSNGEKIYWEAMEVKGLKGYANFWDAYNGTPTFHANYFPRIAQIDINTPSISDFYIIGGTKGKNLLYKDNAIHWDNLTKTRYYIGHDDKYKKLFVAKFNMP